MLSSLLSHTHTSGLSYSWIRVRDHVVVDLMDRRTRLQHACSLMYIIWVHEDTCTHTHTHMKLSLQMHRALLHSDHFRWNNHQFSSSSNVGVNNGLVQCDLTLFTVCQVLWVCVYVHLSVCVRWLQLIIMCGSLCVCVHALLVLWQAESVCAHNEWGVSEALYCIIPLYSTPEGRKRSECSLISPYITMRVFEKSTTYHQLGLTEAQPWGFSRAHMILLSFL